MSSEGQDHNYDSYAPDSRVTDAYHDVLLGNQDMLESICPDYLELSQDAERYQELSLIGEGSLKEVYRAYDIKSQRWIALARLHRKRGLQYYDSFIAEARLTASLNHPNIIKIYEIGVDAENRPYFTMDLKAGNTLTHWIRNKELNFKQAISVFQKICNATAYAHSQGVLHLDLKPDNIQCNKFGEVLICDWGLGQFIHETKDVVENIEYDEPEIPESTLIDQIAGSPGYMAPEQATPYSDKDERTDIFALGCILHFLLTAEPPFTGSREGIIDQTKNSKSIRSPRLKYPELRIPHSLSAITKKACNKTANNRYQTVLDLKQDLDNFISGYTTNAENPNFFRELRLFLRRNKIPAAISLIAILIGTSGTVVFLQSLKQKEQETLTERQRAEELLSTVDTLYTEYNVLHNTTLATNEELATRLGQAAKRLKNYGIFDRPIQTLRQVEDLTKIALHLDPENEKAREQLFSLHCLRLNYKAALALPQAHYNERLYSSLPSEFPTYNFSESKPAPPEAMINLIQNTKAASTNNEGHIERVFIYQLAINRSLRNNSEILAALIRAFNPDQSHKITANLNKNKQSLYLEFNKSLKLISDKGGSKLSILRIARIRDLNLKTDTSFDLKNLNGLQIQSLDISQCKEIQLLDKVSLPRLKKIFLNREQQIEATIKQFLKTELNLEIIYR